MLEDAQACTCHGSIWAIESAADILALLRWHGMIVGSGTYKLLCLGLAAAGGQLHTTKGVFRFQLHHHRHPVAVYGSYADSWRATQTTTMNCSSWALRQLEDRLLQRKVHSRITIICLLVDDGGDDDACLSLFEFVGARLHTCTTSQRWAGRDDFISST